MHCVLEDGFIPVIGGGNPTRLGPLEDGSLGQLRWTDWTFYRDQHQTAPLTHLSSITWRNQPRHSKA
jgi:hypothetical protein